MRKLANLTTHVVCLLTDEGYVEVQPAAQPARVELVRRVTEEISIGVITLPVYEVSAEEVIGLPPPDGQTIYIVSSIVERYAGRDDVVTVDKLQRGVGGVVLGAKALSRSA